MADRSIKRIDEVEVGDLVLAADPGTGESGPREVVATIIREGVKHLVEIETDGGKIIATGGQCRRGDRSIAQVARDFDLTVATAARSSAF
ncbi:hypothetical protein SAMN05216553_11262 [Lentzea fradiae]|uniref:Uncharacterized protein n=1 Tax=Lentzea fradiae TaxID=200378 RepID=A0A1G7XK39_9PSEU|nr:Hint domain-containing protein [Lentzea fradiae]SDG84537.1 hypothetical protein SAMN05216553_11262 [Lentzea fradiae]